MKFGAMAVATGEGTILAHSVRAPGVLLKKGERLDASHIATLKQAGIATIIAARLEDDDVAEDVAAARIAARIGGDNVRLDRPFTGRCNLFARTAGLVRIDAAMIDAINELDEGITIATLAPLRSVVADEMIATVKIIPFAIPQALLDRALGAALAPSVTVAPYRPLCVGVVSTLLPGLKQTVVTKTLRILEARLVPAGATIAQDIRISHEIAPLARAIHAAMDTELIIVFGASAITDRRDVVPAAIEAAGGVVAHLGMPVDPGNLLLLGRIGHNGRSVPIIGAPGCARSAKENGFDFVLRRLLAGLEVTPSDLRRMGVGGLLTEIATRPQRRGASDG